MADLRKALQQRDSETQKTKVSHNSLGKHISSPAVSINTYPNQNSKKIEYLVD